MHSRLLACALAVSPTVFAAGQACPKASDTGLSVPSEIRTLEGRLVFHDDIRGWFELRLDESQCGQASMQLVGQERTGAHLQVLRGCRVRSRGTLDFSPTGYYSLEMFQDVQSIEPVGKCERQPPFPDYSGSEPDRAIRTYRVDMQVTWGPVGRRIAFRATSAGKELRPWQAYARYYLTAGFVLYGRCGDGFVVDNVFGTPEAHPGHSDNPRSHDDMAIFDPASAASAGNNDLQLGYTCVRNR